MKDKINHQIKGHLEIDFLGVNGEVIERFSEGNLIVDFSKTSIIKCIAGAAQNTYGITAIQMGDDVGTGTTILPEAPEADYTSADMSLVYQTAGVDVMYPTSTSVLFSITIDGNLIVDAANTKYATSNETANLNSAVLMAGNGEPFSYKRFPVKVVTRFIDVTVRWTIEF